MSTRVYILSLEGEPQYVTTNLQRIKDECQEWFDDHRDSLIVRNDFEFWNITHPEYLKSKEGMDASWCDYVNDAFKSGTWADYAWYDAWLD